SSTSSTGLVQSAGSFTRLCTTTTAAAVDVNCDTNRSLPRYESSVSPASGSIATPVIGRDPTPGGTGTFKTPAMSAIVGMYNLSSKRKKQKDEGCTGFPSHPSSVGL